MCRNIRTLHNFEPAATHEEVHAAALQYVRKISGATKPSQANEELFARAVEAVKVFVVDLWSLSGFWRVGAFAGLAVTLLVGAVAFQRIVLKDRKP